MGVSRAGLKSQKSKKKKAEKEEPLENNKTVTLPPPKSQIINPLNRASYVSGRTCIPVTAEPCEIATAQSTGPVSQTSLLKLYGMARACPMISLKAQGTGAHERLSKLGPHVHGEAIPQQ